MATKAGFLVTKVEVVVPLGTVFVTILSSEITVIQYIITIFLFISQLAYSVETKIAQTVSLTFMYWKDNIKIISQMNSRYCGETQQVSLKYTEIELWLKWELTCDLKGFYMVWGSSHTQFVKYELACSKLICKWVSSLSNIDEFRLSFS